MIIFKVLFVVVLASPTFGNNSVANIVHHSSLHETILCRACGRDIASTKHIIPKASPVAEYSFYDRVFNESQDVLVQMLTDLLLFNFPIVTLSESTCSGVGEWDESSWFPGYQSRPCICPECGTYIGWEYQPVDQKALADSDSFFGFILPNIIGETCK